MQTFLRRGAQMRQLPNKNTLEREFFMLSGIPKLEFAHRTKLKVSTSPCDLLFLQSKYHLPSALCS